MRGDEVVVKADPEALKSNKRVKAMSRADPSNKKTFVIVGGGEGQRERGGERE